MIEIVDNTGHLDANDLNHSAYLRGVEHFKATNYYLAAQSFSEALGYWLEDPQAWFALGNCYDAMGKPKDAERCFRTALDHSPPEKMPDVHYNLGNSLYDQGRFLTAVDFFEKIPKNHPIYREAQKNRSRALEQLAEQEAENDGSPKHSQWRVDGGKEF